MKPTVSICVICLILVSCKKDLSYNGSASLQAVTIQNVSYGNDPLQTMDIYLPAGRSATSTKVMILIHGGAWIQGDKSDFNDYIDTLKQRQPGYAIFNINYRLVNQASATNLFPTQENDVKNAVAFIAEKLNSYNVSNKMVLLGASAGGHLALLQGYKNNTAVSAKAIIDFFGPVSMTGMYYYPASPIVPAIIATVTGGTPTSVPDLYYQSSPINFITSQSPPTIIFQGGADSLVNPSQSDSLNNVLQRADVIHQYVFYPNEAHGWAGTTLTDSFNRIDSFLTANVR
jgi:acetyl esterase/lipase